MLALSVILLLTINAHPAHFDSELMMTSWLILTAGLF
jgi:hypothetical protein